MYPIVSIQQWTWLNITHEHSQAIGITMSDERETERIIDLRQISFDINEMQVTVEMPVLFR